jgi:hypothetical protein
MKRESGARSTTTWWWTTRSSRPTTRAFSGRREGELVAEDLGTLNGLYAEHGARRATRLSLAKEPGLRIGRTIVRVRDGASSVDPERLLTPPRAHVRWAVGLGAALIALVLVVQWLANTGEASANLAVLPLLGIATAIAVWASLWSMQSRLFLGQSRFAVHLRIALTAALALLFWDQLDDTLSVRLRLARDRRMGGLGLWALLAGRLLRAPARDRHAPHELRDGTRDRPRDAGALLQYVGRSESKKILGERATLGRPAPARIPPRAARERGRVLQEGGGREAPRR